MRLWLEVSEEPDTDIMVHGQGPRSAGRSKRRNVSYLGLVPPAIGRRIEITALYKDRYREPQPGTKVFIVTCPQKNGWKGQAQETSEVIPGLPAGYQASTEAGNSQNLYMCKGGTTGGQGSAEPEVGPSPEVGKPPTPGGKAAKAGLGAETGASGTQISPTGSEGGG